MAWYLGGSGKDVQTAFPVRSPPDQKPAGNPGKSGIWGSRPLPVKRPNAIFASPAWSIAVIIDDEDTPRPRPRKLASLPLDLLGVAELESYIEELRTEITRVEAEIARKSSHRSAADAFFRKP
jgi:uncharacterized small protein (DUF1192 family)